METLTLKLILIPTITGAASLVGRRWGPAISGWLVALPLTSAPIIFFLALGQGAGFAADSAMGTLAGGLSLSAFCLVYHLMLYRFAWPASIVASAVTLLAANELLQYLRVPLAVLLALVCAALAFALWVIRADPSPAAPPSIRLPAWDIPARMVVATGFVLLVTGMAPLLGPRLSGLAATFPLVAGTMTVFTHQQLGAEASRRVLRGLLIGLFSFAGFYGVLIALLVPAGIALAFIVAIVLALIVQAVTLAIMRRMERGSSDARR